MRSNLIESMRSLQMPPAADRISRAMGSSWPTIRDMRRGRANGPRKSATFMSGFPKLAFELHELKDRQTSKRLVTYHEACHLCHGQKITRQPREILNGIPSIDLIELTESTWCCGSAGIYNITQPEMAAKLQERKVRHIVESGASIVATANPGCLLQLESGLRKFSQRIAVRHPISLLAEAYRSEE